jgi:hypothetical protein
VHHLPVAVDVTGDSNLREERQALLDDSLSDPDIAVNDPDNISFRFTVCAAHIPDLGIRV